MSWKMISKPETKRATHQLVNEFFNMTPAPGDRNLRVARATRLRHLILTGQYRTGEFASAFCHETGETYRVNGKHTSTVMAAMNGELPKDVYLIVERYECDTLDDVARLYATFDNPDSIRNTSDINRSFAALHGELADVSDRVVDTCVTGMAFERWEDAYTSIRREERSAMILENVQFILWFHGIAPRRNDSCKHILRGPVAAAMYRTFCKAQKPSTEFWTLVRDGSGSNHTNADRTLHRYLITHSVANGRGSSKSDKKTAGQREMYVKCLHGWNAWRKGVPTDLKYHPKSDAPRAS